MLVASDDCIKNIERSMCVESIPDSWHFLRRRSTIIISDLSECKLAKCRANVLHPFELDHRIQCPTTRKYGSIQKYLITSTAVHWESTQNH